VTLEEIEDLIRMVPDFPKPGILFRDITTLMADGAGFSATVGYLAEDALSRDVDAIAGIEARGFIFGAAVAARLSLPFIPIRKPGKLPVPVLAMDYALEYGTDTLEIDPDAIASGQRILLVDDLIATGGTAHAAVALLRKAGAEVPAAQFVIDLPDLAGADRLRKEGVAVTALIAFPGH